MYIFQKYKNYYYHTCVSFAYTVNYIIFIIMIYQSLQTFYPRYQPSVQQMFCRLVLLTVRLQEPQHRWFCSLDGWWMHPPNYIRVPTNIHTHCTYTQTYTYIHLHICIHTHTLDPV